MIYRNDLNLAVILEPDWCFQSSGAQGNLFVPDYLESRLGYCNCRHGSSSLVFDLKTESSVLLLGKVTLERSSKIEGRACPNIFVDIT